MAEETNHSIGMESATHIPIAQLTPLLNAPATRYIKAVVTLKWPYSSATGSIAFLLSEPDFRLRKTRGQVRVQFAGSSAKSVAKAGIASGDEISLGLDGVEWVESQDSIGTPGRGVEFELKFTEKLYLQFKQADASEFITIDIDHPAPVVETAPVFARIPTPEPSPSPALPTTNGTSTKPAVLSEVLNEWSSPAFLKRARTSYGSLFEADYDPFSEDDDGSVQGKGRKRTRLSAVWRYASRSPSPEPVEQTVEIPPAPSPKPAPTMMDEACQTDSLETGVAAETLAGFARQATNIGSTLYSQLLNGSDPPNDIVPTGMEEDTGEAAMPPPRIQTQPPDLSSDPATEFNRQAPSSPRLHPIPSDSLPLVSPLISHNYGFSFGRPLQAAQDTSTQLQPAIPNGVEHIDDVEDLYGASPIRRRSNLVTHEFDGFQEPAGGGQSADFPAIGGPIAMEHQYGQWQTTNAQYSHPTSPSKGNDYDYEQPHIGRAYEKEQGQSEDELPSSRGHVSQYPEIDPELTGAVRYPDLHQENRIEDGDYQVEEKHEIVAPALAPAMSRSQSAQSAVIDLTEDSDDEEEEAPQNKDEGSMRGSEYEADPEEKEAEDLRRYGLQDEVQTGRHAQRDNGADYSDESDIDAEGEEELDEFGNPIYDDADDNVEQDTRYGQVEDEDEEGSFDEEESYDEEELEEEAHPPEPVVIELSSDDEDANEPSRPVPQTSGSQSQRSQAAESGNESDESDEDEEFDDETEIPYNERQEVRTRLQPDAEPPKIYEEDDDMYEADGDEEDIEGEEEGIEGDEEGIEGDEEDVDGGDDVSSIDEETHRPQAASQVVSLSSGSEDEAEEDQDMDPASDEDAPEQDSHDIEVDDDEPRTPDDSEQLQATKDETLEQSESMKSSVNEEESPEQSSSALNGLAFDGADDERLPTQLSYPDLPNEPSPPASVQGGSLPNDQLEPLMQIINNQLPTPETSQLVDKIMIAESSFTSTVVEAISETTTSVETRSILTEVKVSDVTTQVSSVQLNIPQIGEGDVSAHVTEPDDDKDDLQENEDVLMGDAGNDEPSNDESKAIDVTVIQENIESSLIEEDVEADQTNKGEVELLADRSELNDELQEILSQREDSPMEEIAEADEDATAVESDGTDGSETSEILAIEQQGVTTRSAAHAQAKAETDNDDGSDSDDPSSQLVQEQQMHDEEVAEEPEFTVEHPRRSHRRVKSTASATATKAEDSARPVTPVKPRAAQPSDTGVVEPRSSTVAMDNTRSAPKGHDASFELALSSLESPSKPSSHDLRKAPVADIKLRLSRALRTELSEFTALKVIRYHMNQKLDVLAIATTTPPEPQRAKGGPRHYQITFNITDPSIAPSGVTEVQVFRPYSHALPTISAGDGILLRNFQVSSVQKGFALRSTLEEGSSWAVFKDEGAPEVRGPPVEYGDAEKNHVLAMKAWYKDLDDEAKAKIKRANENKAARR